VLYRFLADCKTLKKYEITQFKTGYGEQVRCLRARSTISDVLQFLYIVANGIADTISSKTFLKFFARLFFKKAAFPLHRSFAIG